MQLINYARIVLGQTNLSMHRVLAHKHWARLASEFTGPRAMNTGPEQTLNAQGPGL